MDLLVFIFLILTSVWLRETTEMSTKLEFQGLTNKVSERH